MLILGADEVSLQRKWNKRDYRKYFVDLCEYPALTAWEMLSYNLTAILGNLNILEASQKAALVEGVTSFRKRVEIEHFSLNTASDRKLILKELDNALEKLQKRRRSFSFAHVARAVSGPIRLSVPHSSMTNSITTGLPSYAAEMGRRLMTSLASLSF